MGTTISGVNFKVDRRIRIGDTSDLGCWALRYTEGVNLEANHRNNLEGG